MQALAREGQAGHAAGGGGAGGLSLVARAEDDEERDSPADEGTEDDPGTEPYATLHADGPRASEGSASHPDGCTACTFYCFTRRGCNRGEGCRFCHLAHESKLQKRREAWKKQQRELRRSTREKKLRESCEERPALPAALSMPAGKDGIGFMLGIQAPATSLSTGSARPKQGGRKERMPEHESWPVQWIQYSPSHATLCIGQEVEFRPSSASPLSGFRPVTPLPRGLLLDPASGVISGVPEAPMAETPIFVEADMRDGSRVQAAVDLEVVDLSVGGFALGHLCEIKPGQFMMLMHVPEDSQAASPSAA